MLQNAASDIIASYINGGWSHELDDTDAVDLSPARPASVKR